MYLKKNLKINFEILQRKEKLMKRCYYVTVYYKFRLKEENFTKMLSKKKLISSSFEISNLMKCRNPYTFNEKISIIFYKNLFINLQHKFINHNYFLFIKI